MSRLPNFFIPGAVKSGTTALYYMLKGHPQVHLSTPKEPTFFEADYERGLEYYWQRYFAEGWQGQKWVGEARVLNLVLPYVPARIHTVVPDARFIIILRDPVESAFSLWWMRYCNGMEKLDFDKGLQENIARIATGATIDGPDAERIWCSHRRIKPNRFGVRPSRLRLYLEAGYYAQQIERYLEYFSRSQFCFVRYDDLCRSPITVTRQIYAFLDLDIADAPKAIVRENVGLTSFSRPFFNLSSRLHLEKILPRKVLASARTALSKIGPRPSMSPMTNEWLYEHYKPHNRRLEKLLGWDLSAWRS